MSLDSEAPEQEGQQRISGRNIGNMVRTFFFIFRFFSARKAYSLHCLEHGFVQAVDAAKHDFQAVFC